MFGLGWPEILLVLVLALIFLGPKKLPEAAKGLGKALAEFRRAGEEVRDTIETEIQRADETARIEAAKARARAATPPPAIQPAQAEPVAGDKARSSVTMAPAAPPAPPSGVEETKKDAPA